MSKHLLTAVRKNSPITGRNLKQNLTLGVRPSALTSWVERERRGWGVETQRSRTATTTTTIIDTLIAATNSNNRTV